MAIHFRCNHEQLRPLGRATRGVKAMKLRDKDELVGMDILPAAILATLNTDIETEIEEVETEELLEVDANEESVEVAGNGSTGPWVLVITMGGMASAYLGFPVPPAKTCLRSGYHGD